MQYLHGYYIPWLQARNPEINVYTENEETESPFP